MRKIFGHLSVTILFLITTLLYSCMQPTKEELIIGKWSFDHINKESVAKGRELSSSAELQISMQEGMLKGLSMEFFQDKSYEMTLSPGLLGIGGTVKGTYKFENDNKYVSTQVTNKNDKQRIEKNEILVLTKDELVLQDNKGIIYNYKRIK